MKRSANLLRTALAALGLWLGLAEHAAAMLAFDKLNACAAVGQAYAALQSRDSSVVGNCRMPQTLPMWALGQRTMAPYQQYLCFLPAPPTSVLAGFECATYAPGQGIEMLCTRVRTDIDPQDYRARYATTYATPVANYIAAAARCSASNGDSSIATQPSAPAILNIIARFEFGYAVQLGETIPAGAMMLHGYATLDPSFGAGQGIEFIHVTVSAPATALPTHRLGRWDVATDAATDLEAHTSQLLTQSGAPLFYDLTGFTVRLARDVPLAQGDKVQRQARWMRRLVGTLEAEGFRYVSDAELQSRSPTSYAAIREQLRINFPYGMDESLHLTPAEDFYLLISETTPPCTYDGMMMAIVMGVSPPANPVRDYGNVSFILSGVGACSAKVGSTRIFVERVIRNVTEDFESRLETE